MNRLFLVFFELVYGTCVQMPTEEFLLDCFKQTNNAVRLLHDLWTVCIIFDHVDHFVECATCLSGESECAFLFLRELFVHNVFVMIKYYTYNLGCRLKTKYAYCDKNISQNRM